MYSRSRKNTDDADGDRAAVLVAASQRKGMLQITANRRFKS